MKKISVIVLFLFSVVFCDDNENLQFLIDKANEIQSLTERCQKELFKSMNPQYTEESSLIQTLIGVNLDIKDKLSNMAVLYGIKTSISGEDNKEVVQNFINIELQFLSQLIDSKLEAIYYSLSILNSSEVKRIENKVKDILFEVRQFKFK